MSGPRRGAGRNPTRNRGGRGGAASGPGGSGDLFSQSLDRLEAARRTEEEEEQVRQVLTGYSGGPDGMQPRYQPLPDAARNIFAMPPDDLQDLQMKLFAAGFYGNADFGDIMWQTPGPDTYDAFIRFLDHAADWTDSSGEPTPWFAALDQLAGTDVASARMDGALAGPDPEEPPFIPMQATRLSDPAGLRRLFDGAAESTLGRRLSPDQQRAFVALIHNLEKQTSDAQYAVQTADGTGGEATMMQPDLTAQALEFARREEPGLAAASDTSKTYEMFVDIIRGR
jgi:hypothetical protein